MNTQVKRSLLSFFLCLFNPAGDVKAFIDQLSEDGIDYLYDLNGDEIDICYGFYKTTKDKVVSY